MITSSGRYFQVHYLFDNIFIYLTLIYKKIFIITGDFNFPRISWSENVVTATGESGRLFHNIPTRQNVALDLIITNIPDNINNIEVINPNNFTMFSDHKCVPFDYQDSVTASHKLTNSNYRFTITIVQILEQ